MEEHEEKPLKYLSSPNVLDEKENNHKFYLRYYLLLVVVFPNSLVYYSLNPESSSVLLISICFLLFLIIYSMLTIICPQNANYGSINFFFSFHALIILTGVCIILLDPSILKIITGETNESYLSCLQSLILLSALGYKYTEYSWKFPLLIIVLGSISLGLSLIVRKDTGKVYFEYIVLIAFILSGSMYLSKSPIVKAEKTNIATQNFNGVEEITNHIDKLLENIIEVNEKPSTKDCLTNIINQLKEVNQKIRQSPNIYTAQIGAITKNMDEQDKLFIEQACFESHTQSMVFSPKPLENIKEYELNYGISELAGVLKNIGSE